MSLPVSRKILQPRSVADGGFATSHAMPLENTTDHKPPQCDIHSCEVIKTPWISLSDFCGVGRGVGSHVVSGLLVGGSRL